MNKPIRLLCMFWLCSTLQAKAQSYRSQQNQLFAWNILSNGVMGGVGGMINRDHDEKWYMAFARNFGKGCLGGLVKYTAKNQTYYLRYSQNQFLALPNRLLYFAGHSITMNASLNKGIFDTYYCNILGVDMRWHLMNVQDDEKRFQARVSLMSVASALSVGAQHYSFDFYKSLEMGCFYFVMDTPTLHNGVKVTGFQRFNSIAIGNSPFGGPYPNTIPHEFVHIYQSYDFFSITNFFYPRYIKPKIANTRWYGVINRFIVPDVDVAYFIAAYTLQPKPTYYRNFFEFEAEHFSSRRYIPR
jgi:hypothetical protein